MPFDLTILIGGAAGQGVHPIPGPRALLRHGCQVFYLQDYQSRIRGGHIFNQVRLADHPLAAGPLVKQTPQRPLPQLLADFF